MAFEKLRAIVRTAIPKRLLDELSGLWRTFVLIIWHTGPDSVSQVGQSLLRLARSQGSLEQFRPHPPIGSRGLRSQVRVPFESISERGGGSCRGSIE
jgi:hypothetical protein